MPELELVAIPNGQFAENCYLLGDPHTGEAVLVDPGEESGRFLEALSARQWQLTAIWLTHAHIDHVLGVGAVHDATGAPIHLHPDGRILYDNMVYQARQFGIEVAPLPPPTHELTHGEEVAVGRSRFEVRSAPGHAPGHVVFVGEGMVLGGDVLFAGSIGRTDLPGGDSDTLLTSIRTELLTLPDDTVVFPGHGPQTTIGRERVTNPFLTGL